MIFNSAIFCLFFLLVFVFYFLVGRSKTQRLLILTFFNLVFYASWNLKFVPLLLGMGILDFYIAKHMGRSSGSENRARRKTLLIFSFVSNIGLLVFFKYTDFLIGAGSALISMAGGNFAPNYLHLIAPLGISFYTFQSLSYTIDVYRGSYKPRETFLEFIASLTFFPHLLAGPIVRSSFLVPQFSELKEPEKSTRATSVILVASGLAKKTLADLVAPIVASAYSVTESPSLIKSWAGVLGFAGQMYGDFSGYSDMAIGLALLLGFRLPINFNLPYFSTSPPEFWKRWHISLSTWFRDYLYYPLALGAFKRHPYLNLCTVMVIAGVWHGATWNCVLFGAYHGVLLMGTQWLAPRIGFDPFPGRALKIAATFYFILLGQVMFRSTSLESFVHMIKGMHGFGIPSDLSQSEVTRLFAAISVLVFGHFIDWFVKERKILLERPPIYWGLATSSFTLAMIVGVHSAFIYFQF